MKQGPSTYHWFWTLSAQLGKAAPISDSAWSCVFFPYTKGPDHLFLRMVFKLKLGATEMKWVRHKTLVPSHFPAALYERNWLQNHSLNSEKEGSQDGWLCKESFALNRKHEIKEQCGINSFLDWHFVKPPAWPPDCRKEVHLWPPCSLLLSKPW